MLRRRPNLSRRLGRSLVVAALMIVSWGCGGATGTSPEAQKGGTSRDLVEHPLDALGKGKTPPPVPPKVKAALEKAKLADPRGR